MKKGGRQQPAPLLFSGGMRPSFMLQFTLILKNSYLIAKRKQHFL